VTYHAKVCYSNGFKVVEALAPNSLSTIQDPSDGDFEYKVELASSVQSSGPYLFTWVAKLSKQQDPGPGMKVQYAGDKADPNKWSDFLNHLLG